MNVTFKRR